STANAPSWSHGDGSSLSWANRIASSAISSSVMATGSALVGSPALQAQPPGWWQVNRAEIHELPHALPTVQRRQQGLGPGATCVGGAAAVATGRAGAGTGAGGCVAGGAGFGAAGAAVGVADRGTAVGRVVACGGVDVGTVVATATG